MSDINQDGPNARYAFLTELQTLPAVNDAVTKAKDLYNTTKDYKCVGMALCVASVGVKAATSMLPLTVLTTSMGGWKAIDQWACQKLDTMKIWAPSITKPTTEIVDDAREKILKVVAGGTVTPPTLAGALTARADYTVCRLNEYRGGRVVVNIADSLVDKARALLDKYLPQTDGVSNESDGSDGGLVPKTLDLAVQAHLRAYRAVHVVVHTDANCKEFSTAHLVNCAGNYTKQWLSDVEAAKPEIASVTRVTAALAVHITTHATVTLQALLAITRVLYDGSAADFAVSYLTYSHGVALRTAVIMALSLQLLKLICEDMGKLSSDFRVRLTELTKKRVDGAIPEDKAVPEDKALESSRLSVSSTD